jgi:hypothetical protein
MLAAAAPYTTERDMLIRRTLRIEESTHRPEATMDNNETPVRTDGPLELFEAAAVAALRAGYSIDDFTPCLLSAIDKVVEMPPADAAADVSDDAE